MLYNMIARLYYASGLTYKQISSEQAIVDEKADTITYGRDLKTVIKFTKNLAN